METSELAPDAPRTQTDPSPSIHPNTADALAPHDAPDNPWAPDEGRCVSLEEYWNRWYENPYPDIDVSYEWNNGSLEAKPLPNAPQLDLYNWFLSLLLCHVETFQHAALINLETGFVLKIEDAAEPSGARIQVRKPDTGVILHSNPVSWGGSEQRHFAGVCDMVVEALSDSTPAEVLRDTEEKRRDYALGGVKEYYILDPDGERMRFYRLAADGRYAEIRPDAEGVVRSEVLAGLQFRLADLRRRPRLAELARDEVYSGYVIPELQVAVTRAEGAEEQATVEVAARQQAEEQAAVEATARQQAEEQAAVEAAARQQAEEQAAVEVAARQQAEEQAAVEAAARQQAEEQAAVEAQRADREAAARRQTEERMQSLEAELARLRQQSS